MTGATAAGLIIASAADSGYFPLLQDAVASVRALNSDVAIGVLDLGLAPAERDWLQERAARVVRPDWDVDFPGRERTPETLKAQVARPFLPRHFPGHEMYFWLDADAWLQEWRIVELYCKAAGRDKLAIVPEIDRAYKRHYKRPKLFGWTLAWKCYREAFGWRIADRLGRNPILNSGVFALHYEAPHWQAWQRILTDVLQRTRFVLGEQIALNYAVFAEQLPTNLLPSYCNWMPGDAPPAFDGRRGMFVEPYAPHETIGVMHLAGSEQKTQLFRLQRLEGGTVETGLRYRDTRELCAARFAISA
ncbi:MAG: hypothetical protein JO204_01075 [Alphaproteobacteria bacterium]|nr:hypothetical protein [Alphaproteobacteria bacterium]